MKPVKPLIYLCVAAVLSVGVMAAATRGDASIAAILASGAVFNIAVAWAAWRGRS